MAQFGCFSWLQAFAAVTFMHGDRLLVGAFLGTSEVAYYSICVQATQPIHGLLSSGLNFLFPNLSRRYEAADLYGSRSLYKKALWASIIAVIGITIPLMLLSKPILRLWMGSGIAQNAHGIFSILALAYGVLALNVVPHYALLALGQIRYVSMVNILGGTLSLFAAAALMPHLGLYGAALGRLLYGPAVSMNLFKSHECMSRTKVQAFQ
jgi:O-antigen/teichoic acid export membrane protein